MLLLTLAEQENKQQTSEHKACSKLQMHHSTKATSMTDNDMPGKASLPEQL
jgi:hypothetical protein